MTPSLDLRSYSGECAHHQHGFTQLVLPVVGGMEMEVQGRGARLDLSMAALIAPGAAHGQRADGANRFLVLDCPNGWFEARTLEALARRTYVPVSAATRRLIEFADLLGPQGLPGSAAHLLPLLLDSLGRDAGQPASGMDRLLAHLEADPGQAWSNEAMARVAAMSVSQLHRRFAERYAQAPQAWLAQLRMRHACRWLAESRLPLADIALKVGFSDQAALTRAMRRLCDTTPAAYRHAARQPG
ncbi:AraC family transcriptional regulator [Pseudomonas sp. App30]|uniref:helix-turn-helix transcriptional regulator n=1 Tax=Pseudomonas sp. App30 TaxID=3068990 RepID=UPI003A8025E1